MYKSTADYEAGKALYSNYSEVDEGFLGMRQVVLERRTPRRMFVQAHTKLEGEFSSNLSNI